MKIKLAALALCFAILLPGPASASTTRVLSLGLDNWQLADEVNFWSNPARLKAAPNLGLFEVGTQTTAGTALNAASQWGGFHKSIGSTVMALYVRRPYQTNDFTTSATSLTTPFTGGMITEDSVLVDIADATTGDFGTQGPFGTAAGSVLSIGGAPSSPRDLAQLQNYLDFIYAWSWGRMDWGLHVNYARNAGGETSRILYDSGPSATNPGKIRLERLSEETNVRLGFLWNGFENSWFQMTADATIPNYSVEYDEDRLDGQFTRSRIDNDNAIQGGLSAQFSRRLENDSSFGINARAGIMDASGVASRQDGGGAAAVSRHAYFADVRKFAMIDYTWSHRFSELNSLVVASGGYQRTLSNKSWHFTDDGSANDELDSVRVEQWTLPLRVAIESKPWNLLALRGGIQKNIFSEARTRTRDSDTGGAPTENETDAVVADPTGTSGGVGLSFGVGIHLAEGLMWDTVVRQRILFDGPDVVGGQAPGFLAQSTLVYRWGGGRDATYSDLKPWLNLKRALSRLSDPRG